MVFHGLFRFIHLYQASGRINEMRRRKNECLEIYRIEHDRILSTNFKKRTMAHHPAGSFVCNCLTFGSTPKTARWHTRRRHIALIHFTLDFFMWFASHTKINHRNHLLFNQSNLLHHPLLCRKPPLVRCFTNHPNIHPMVAFHRSFLVSSTSNFSVLQQLKISHPIIITLHSPITNPSTFYLLYKVICLIVYLKYISIVVGL